VNKSLNDLAPGEGGRVASVEGGLRVRQRLHSLGFVEGATVHKLSNLAWGGPVVVEVNRVQVAIGRGMARRVSVEV